MTLSLFELEKELRLRFPHGHQSYVSILLEQMKLHSDKNQAYTQGGNPLGNFDRVAAILSLYPGFPYDTPVGVAFIYALKQLDAEAWNMCQGTEDKVEGFAGRTNDQAVYSNIRRCIRQRGRTDEAVSETPQVQGGAPTKG